MELTGKNYQVTEAGMIPNDWEVKLLMEICSPAKARINPLTATESYKCVELEHLSQETGRLLGYADTKDLKSQKTVFQKNDILFGKLRPYLKKYLFAKFDGVCTTEIWVLKSPSYIDNKWLYYLVQSNRIIEAANQSTGTKMPRAEWKTVGNTPIPLPSTKSEQIAIATALSDIDTLIENLERLIAKKRNIKEGTMQELLSGGKRLLGFAGEWKLRQFTEVCDLIHGYQFRTNDFINNDNGIKVIKIGNVLDGRFETDSCDCINSSRIKEFSAYLIKEGDILMSLTGNIGRVVRVKKIIEPLLQNYRVGKFVPKSINADFLTYSLASIQTTKQLELLSNQTSQANFGKQDFVKVNFKIPPSIEEQLAVATILNDMADEIEVLEKELYKYRMIKQGMMQALLTGKIRLS